MKMNHIRKKGDISLETIIIAVLALIVLVVLSVIFVSKMREGNTNISGCESKGGKCKVECGPSEIPTTIGDCSSDAQNSICCLGATEFGK
jgi:uncharacterized protein (UPF0333 family)